MKKIFLWLLAALAVSLASARSIDLSGQWSIRFTDKGGARDTLITLPGSMLTNGLGNIPDASTKWTGSLYDLNYYYSPDFEKYRQPGNIKYPFFLTPDREFVGVADYSRTVSVPSSWKGSDITLFIERPHITTEVYVNGRLAGRDSSLSVPHSFNLTPLIRPGRENLIQVRVSNFIDNVCVGQDSHSVTDQTQGNWNGMAGRIELVSRPKTRISNVQIFPRLASKSIDVTAEIANPSKKESLSFIVDSKTHSFRNLPVTDGKVSVSIPLGPDVRLWDEFTPELYTLSAVLGTDTVTETFGMREITATDRQFFINGRPLWLRGTVENCCFPLTGFPPADVDSWLAIFRKCKEYGINHVRFHSYCPPEAAFEAADRVGIYLQPEGPSWPNHGVLLGNGMTIDRYLFDETERMVREYGNHPSFAFLAAGNEPAGNWVEWVGDFVDRWRATGDDRRLYCGASVGGGWAWDPRSQYHVKGGARGLTWSKKAPGSADDFASDMETVVQKGRTQTLTFPVSEPRVGHEVGQWCAFPDFSEMDLYTGPYKARNFEIFRESLARNGMDSLASRFLNASGKLQTLAYKYDIERNLRTPDYSGFQLLGLNDYSGQGTALVGVLNVFWKEKGYCDSTSWRQFCSPTVPLARFPKFVFTPADSLVVPVELYNAVAAPLVDAPVSVSVTGPDGSVMPLSSFSRTFPVGKNLPVDTVDVSLASAPVGRHTLTVSVGPASNSWNFWVYPPASDPMPDSSGIYICDSLDSKAEDVLRAGGNVLLTAAGKIRLGSDIVQHYLPVFWNTSWFKMRPPHTTGAVIRNTHPLFRNFPSADWADLDWWELLNRSQVINMEHFPASYMSPVQPVDTWHVNRRLGMIVEGRMHNGKILLTTLPVGSGSSRRPVAAQMRRALISYMSSPEFNPSETFSPQLISDLFTRDADPVLMYTDESPDELKPVLK